MLYGAIVCTNCSMKNLENSSEFRIQKRAVGIILDVGPMEIALNI